MDNRLARIDNIVICGFPKESGTTVEQTAEDKAFVREVFTVRNVEVGVADLRRLGKFNKNRSNLLCVTLWSICDKQEVLRKSKSLKKVPALTRFSLPTWLLCNRHSRRG